MATVSAPSTRSSRNTQEASRPAPPPAPARSTASSTSPRDKTSFTPDVTARRETRDASVDRVRENVASTFASARPDLSAGAPSQDRPFTRTEDLPDGRPAGPLEGTAQERRRFGIPAALDRNLGGPPALPSSGVTKQDIDPKTGKPFLGALPDHSINPLSHQYSRRSALPEGLTKQQATETFRRFNAPTNEALRGEGNDPSKTSGSVDPSVMWPVASERGRLPFRRAGGDVTLTHGDTPQGMPWAINSTKLKHPFIGHVTRTLEEHEGRFYIRTDGIGRGNDHTLGARHLANWMSGTTSFGRLDELASDYARRRFLTPQTGHE